MHQRPSAALLLIGMMTITGCGGSSDANHGSYAVSLTEVGLQKKGSQAPAAVDGLPVGGVTITHD